MKVIIHAEWLKGCGWDEYEGIPIEVVKVEDFGHRGKMYHVTLPNGYPWVVWSIRGVTEVGD